MFTYTRSYTGLTGSVGMSSNEDQLYNTLNLTHLTDALSTCPSEQLPVGRISFETKRNKRQLLKLLLASGAYWVEKLNKIAADVCAQNLRDRQSRRAQRTKQQHALRQEVQDDIEMTEDFLYTPSQDDYMRCYRAFYEATSNDAIKQLVCGICARLLNSNASRMTQIELSNLPNRHRLFPTERLSAHNLIEGCLLEEKGCFKDDAIWKINVCNECLTDLQKKSPLPPKLSLANNLWVGSTPSVLERLGFAERLLIARAYPRVFAFKLFPKGPARYGVTEEHLQSAMRGNVTSFELNSEAINDMINGNLMPQDTSVLASVLSVTLIGKRSNIKSETLTMFRVHRQLVQDALEWLKTNNPKYYGNIIIDRSRLNKLPIDGIPDEIYHSIRHDEDVSNIIAESDGYVPMEDEGEDIEGGGFHRENSPDRESVNNQADVVPLQYLGVMDNDLSKVSTNELLSWGLRNTWKTDEDSECGYAVRWGAPVNTFGQPPRGQAPLDPNRPNYWERAFPLLYPYGVGGIEADRPVNLSLIEHARWALRHHDRRFRYHDTFIFVVFGIHQRRQALSSAKIQMRRKDFHSIAKVLDTITRDDLKRAGDEEDRGQKPSNPAILTLKENITATFKRVVGSGPARVQLRSQIWSTCMVLNPPTLWMTINPDDLHDPLAQVFVGEDIDMDAFVETAGPDSDSRSKKIARDPFAAGEFFHFLITTIIEKLFGITTAASRVHSRPGVLGRVKAYFGTVECQGRGTLHLHLLLWLHNSPPASQVQEMLKTTEFQARVLAYLKSNIRSYHPLLATPAALKSIPSNNEVAYSRPPNPDTPLATLLPMLRQLEAKVVRTKQIHKNHSAIESTIEHTSEERVHTRPENETLEDSRDCNVQDSEAPLDSVVLHFSDSGKLHHRSQVDDYTMRGNAASNYNMLDYFTGTYEQSTRKDLVTTIADSVDNSEEIQPQDIGDQSSHTTTRGRPRNLRISYSHSHPRYSTHVRVFPRRSDPSQEELYAISMLTLLKPWHSLEDLKSPEQSWSQALDDFVSNADRHIQDILDNLEHYHTCRTAAEEEQRTSEAVNHTEDQPEAFLSSDNVDIDAIHHPHRLDSRDITEKMIDDLHSKAENQRDTVYGMHAVSITRAKGVFNSPRAPIICITKRATDADELKLKEWQGLLKREKTALNDLDHSPVMGANNEMGDVVPLDSHNTVPYTPDGPAIPDQVLEKAIEPVPPTKLYPEQQRAFSIVKWHLSQTLETYRSAGSEKIPQMLMLMIGEGGTGKSKVIQTITQEFVNRGVSHTLVKSAYTGIAASLIDGKTTHQIAGIVVGQKDQTLSIEARKRLAIFWKNIRYLIIDECSMLSKEFFAKLSRHIQIAKMEYDPTVFDLPFGGINVILCGDLHQFPPVASSSHGALYHPTKPGTSPSQVNQAAGRSLYEKFDTVVMLKTQVRVSDPEWRGFLDALRRGMVNDQHIKMLKDMVLTSPNCKQPDFESELWRECVLVTPRHSVRKRWNAAAAEKHCQQTGNQLFICPTEMTVADQKGRRPVNKIERYVIAQGCAKPKKSSTNRADKSSLTDKVLLAVGMRVMVTSNVETDLDVANGARGTVVEIFLHPNEPPFDSGASVVTLSKLPSHILVKMDRTRATKLPGLSDNVLPILPVSKNFRVVLPIQQADGSVADIPRTIHRLQFPITPAYAFTDYRSQGQTIPAAIIDIATPPTGSALSLYNLYVALSRCAGRDNIRILRDFDEKLLMKPLDYDLLREDERLAKMDNQTEQLWNNLKERNGISYECT
ncbi:hypothetical protein RSOLAG22IIIB_05336 [Rhizoctonia solani]|uniref:ATP-dependent DNA helicase n=1 Tax=Rhizoctonia solani TaxID=456999 RepID=A0A0K6G4P7_9AGAM|nr:hypothetical protein RSOLAG22IIIB_05336 [Rhizoctonia solani]